MKRILIVFSIVTMLFTSCVSTASYNMEPLGDFVMERVNCEGKDWYFLASANETTHPLLQLNLPVVVHDKHDDTWSIGLYYRDYMVAGNLTEDEMERWVYDPWICGTDGSEIMLGGKRYGGMRDFSREDLETYLHILENPEGQYWFEIRRNSDGVISRILGSIGENKSDMHETDSWHATYSKLIIRWYLCQLDNGAKEIEPRDNAARLQNMRDARTAFNKMYDRRWRHTVGFYIADYILLGRFSDFV